MGKFVEVVRDDETTLYINTDHIVYIASVADGNDKITLSSLGNDGLSEIIYTLTPCDQILEMINETEKKNS